MNHYAKAVVGALVAGLTALVTAVAEDGVSGEEWASIVLAVAATFGGVYAKRNGPTPRGQHDVTGG